jgi:hypothetical protein
MNGHSFVNARLGRSAELSVVGCWLSAVFGIDRTPEAWGIRHSPHALSLGPKRKTTDNQQPATSNAAM